jgi:hypothetical protein
MTRDFTVFVGATFSQTFHWTSGGLDVDLSGWEAWMPFGSDVSTSLGELSTFDGTIILNDKGEIKLYLTDEQTEEMFGDPEAIPRIRGVNTLTYQLSLQNEVGEVIRFMRGNLYLQYDVKRPAPPEPPPAPVDVDLTGEELLLEEDLPSPNDVPHVDHTLPGDLP